MKHLVRFIALSYLITTSVLCELEFEFKVKCGCTIDHYVNIEGL